MAQLVAHHTGSVGVRGSNPLSSTRKSQLKAARQGYNPKHLAEWAQDPARADFADGWKAPHAFGAGAHGRLRSDRLSLVRPDQFVAASIPLRGNNGDAEQLKSAMSAHWLLAE